MEGIFQQLEGHMTFVCPECGEIFQTQQQWRQHLNYHHDYLCKSAEDLGFVEVNNRYHECLKCNQLVADGKKAIALLQYHRFLHLPHKSTYRCRHCPGTFMRKRICFDHLCRVHEHIVGTKLAEAAKNSPLFEIKNNNRRSIIAKENPEFYLRYICPQCGIHIKVFELWLNHIAEKHSTVIRPDYALQKISGTQKLFCIICKEVLRHSDNKEEQQRHYFSHLPFKLNFQCAFCRVKRPYKIEMLHHFMRTHLQEFEKHRIYMEKPKEFGADFPNVTLNNEVDFLLKHGNRIGSADRSSWPKFASTTVTNKLQKKKRLSFLQNPSKSNKKDIIQEALADSFIDFENESVSLPTTDTEESLNPSSNIKKDLDDLCAEIFKDICSETTPLDSDQPKNTFNSDNDQLFQESKMETENINNNEEEIVSIEIDMLNEHELNQFIVKNENFNEHASPPAKRFKRSCSSTYEMTNSETYPNLKAIYNAKVLHLCPQCGISFAEQSRWRVHVIKAHKDAYKSVDKSFQLLDDENSNLCLTCNTIIYTTQITELQRHRFTHMPYSAYLKCTICLKCEANKSKMLQHLESKHNTLLSIETKETDEVSKTEGSDFMPLMAHLQNARTRLNRLAAEYGIAML